MKKSNIFKKKNVNGGLKNVSKELLCELCSCILFEGIRCLGCSKSKKVSGNYCGECFNKFQQEVGCCPKMCVAPKTQSLPSTILSDLKELEFKCPNRVNGCSHISNYSDVEDHYSSCGFLLVSCNAQPLCERKYLRKDISSHEKFCKFMKASCQFCDEKNLLRCQLEEHYQQNCTKATKCEHCNHFLPVQGQKEIEHNCIKTMSENIERLEKFNETRDVEHEEELRKRDLKISSLMSKQREIWKYLIKIERSLKQKQTPSTAMASLHPNSVNEDPSEKADDFEDYFSYCDNDSSERAHPLSDTHTENDTNISTLRSDEVPKGFGQRKRADSTFVKRLNDTRMIDEESKSCGSENSFEYEEIDEDKPSQSVDLPLVENTKIIDQDVLKEKLQYFEEITTIAENWKKHSTKNGVELQVYSGEGNYSGVHGKITLPYNNKVVMKILKDQEKSFAINPFGEEIKVIEEIGKNCSIAYMRFKGLLMVSGRDFVVTTFETTMNDPDKKDEKIPILVSYSVVHPDAPENPKGIVRAEIVVAGWILKKIDNDQTEAISFAVNDLKGSIPKFVVNAGSSSHASILTNLKKELEKLDKNGSLPSIENDASLINVSNLD